MSISIKSDNTIENNNKAAIQHSKVVKTIQKGIESTFNILFIIIVNV